MRSDATLELGDSGNLKIGQPVFVVGNPQGLEGTFSNGLVSSIRRFGDDYLVQMTAPISLGSSGGPVLNDEGKVVGVSVGMLQHGQNLNFAIPSEYLANLLKLLRNAPPSGSLVESREKDFYSPSLSLSSRLVQESNKRAGAPKTSIHDLDFIEYTRPSFQKKKLKSSPEDLFIMTR
jgi:S1-C subfamily serine protease